MINITIVNLCVPFYLHLFAPNLPDKVITATLVRSQQVCKQRYKGCLRSLSVRKREADRVHFEAICANSGQAKSSER